jgi:hypothetical protein
VWLESLTSAAEGKIYCVGLTEKGKIFLLRECLSQFTLENRVHFVEECEKEIPKNKVIHKLIRPLRITAEISYLRLLFCSLPLLWENY